MSRRSDFVGTSDYATSICKGNLTIAVFSIYLSCIILVMSDQTQLILWLTCKKITFSKINSRPTVLPDMQTGMES